MKYTKEVLKQLGLRIVEPEQEEKEYTPEERRILDQLPEHTEPNWTLDCQDLVTPPKQFYDDDSYDTVAVVDLKKPGDHEARMLRQLLQRNLSPVGEPYFTARYYCQRAKKR